MNNKQASVALKIFAVFNFIGVFAFTVPGLIYFGLLIFIGNKIKSKELSRWAMRCLVAPDQWWNASLLGEEDETVSSRLGRALLSGKPKLGAKMFAMFVNGIFRVIAGQENHCLESIEECHLNRKCSDEMWSFIKED